MGFIERGLKAIISYDAERDRQMEELGELSPEELKEILKKSAVLGLVGDGGKYVILVGALAISNKTPPPVDCILVPLAVAGAAVGLSAEGYFGIRGRAAKEILYEKGVYLRPGEAIRKLFGK